MARCIRTGGQPLASGELAFHVLDTMIAIDESITHGRAVDITSTLDRLPLIDESWDPFQSTLASSSAR